jgi:histone acetyltransferase 1
VYIISNQTNYKRTDRLLGVHNGAECTHINLVRPSRTGKAPRVFDDPFYPGAPYALFGNDGEIVGYKDPKITLDFRANDLRPRINLQLKQKIDISTLLADADMEQVDIEQTFREHLPECECCLLRLCITRG